MSQIRYIFIYSVTKHTVSIGQRNPFALRHHNEPKSDASSSIRYFCT